MNTLWPRWLSMVCLALFSVTLFANQPVDKQQTVVSLSQASYVALNLSSYLEYIQSEAHHEKSVTLPHAWGGEISGFYGTVWYELSFDAPLDIHSQWAIYLPDINMNAEVWLNGVRIGSGGSMQKPVSRYWHAPMLLSFSSSDLISKNTLVIKVVAYANEFGRLGVVHVGPKQMLLGIYNQYYFSKVEVHIFGCALAALYAFFMMIVWWHRKDPVFFWGALVCAAWAISSTNIFMVNVPLPELVWEKIIHFFIGWIPLLFFFFILRLDGVVFSKRRDRVILSAACLFSFLVLISPENELFVVSRVWHLFSMLFGLSGVVYIVYSWLKNRRHSQFMMVLAFGLIAICGLHDIFVQNALLDDDRTLWLDYSIPIILFLVGYLMVTRFLVAVETSEKLNTELEDRVQQAQEKIEADYDRIILLETEQASNRERERIYRDMHDDMGAKLLSLVYKSETEEMSDLARSAMNDLRAIVSKKPGEKHKLNDVLERWHLSCKKRCQEAKFNLKWQTTKMPEQKVLSAEDEQHLSRLQTEAITNVIKHSKGDTVKVVIRYRFQCLHISVFDNGDFSQLSQWQNSRGLSSMRYRVKQLAGIIHWQQKATGGQVSWLIPIG